MNAANNVVGLHQSSVYEDIQIFLTQHGMHSANTKSLYERSIRKFFMYMKNKNIEDLKVEDLKFRNADVVKYQGHLQQQYDSAGTINSYMAAIVSLYEFLERNEYKVNSKVMKVNLLANDSESYGKLSVQEAEMFAQQAKKQVKGQEKAALIRLAYTTSFRKQELLNITWDDIAFNQDQNIYLVTVIGKGKKKNIKPISQDLYNELLKIKDQTYYSKYNDGKIFHLSETTIQAMMETLKKELGIDEKRNVVFHSLRNVLANYIRETENDVFKIKQQLNHSDINTSMKYIEEEKDYANMAGIQIETKIDEDIFDNLSHEELLKLVKSFGNGIGHQLKTGAKKMIDAR